MAGEPCAPPRGQSRAAACCCDNTECTAWSVGRGEEPWDPRCSGHAWVVLRVPHPEERPAFLGSRAQLVLEMGQVEFAEPDLAGNWSS